MTDRPDYVKCIEHPMRPHPGTAWCHRNVRHEWRFMNIDHAALHARSGSRLIPCPECTAEIASALRGGEVA